MSRDRSARYVLGKFWESASVTSLVLDLWDGVGGWCRVVGVRGTRAQPSNWLHCGDVALCWGESV